MAWSNLCAFLLEQVGGLSIIAAGSYVEENAEVPSGQVRTPLLA